MLEELRTFVLFAEEGSIQSVARRIPLTQPAVSRQIQRLEQTLGAPLLDRRQKPPTLTPVGRDVLAQSRKILQAVEELKGLTRVAEPEGLFRLGLANGLAHERVAQSVAAVMARFPRVALRLKSGWSSELAEQHRQGYLDAAVVLSGEPGRYDGERLGREEIVVVGAAKLKGKARTLPPLGWILSPEPCDARRCLAGKLAQKNRALVLAAEIDDVGLQMGLVRQGVGLGLMPRRLLAQRPPAGIVPLDAAGGTLRLDVLLLRSPHLRAMESVADAVAAELRTLVGG